MTFEKWWSELEGFSLRCERAVEELQIAAANVPALEKWLEAAYEAGSEEGYEIRKAMEWE